ncbi:hypothetical protein GCM10027168_53440 [Streptomyces capparidis]
MDNSLYLGPDTAPDRYRLVRSIGRGGEATLYLAEIQLAGGGEPVVVKVLDSKVTLSPEHFAKVSAKWHEQAELLRFVHRLGVVGVREHFEGPPTHRKGTGDDTPGRALYLVMNHVDGLDLRDWRAERTLESPAERREAMRCLEQLADVLDWLHSGKATPSGRTVVHGDLSPGNVMVDANGQATLVDFGLSKLTAEHQTAEVWFTPGYAAPEVFEGKRSPATDRYAFAAIAYFLLSGQSPPSTPEQLRGAFGALPHLAALDPERAERILSAFAAEPVQRPDTLSQWVRDLRFAVVSTTSATAAGQAVAGGAGAGRAAAADRPEDAAPPVPAAPPADAVPAPPPFGLPITASSAPSVPPPATVPPTARPEPAAAAVPPPPPAGPPVTGAPVAGAPDTQPPVSQPSVAQPPAAEPPPVRAFPDPAAPPPPGPAPAPEPLATPAPRPAPERGRRRGLRVALAVLAVVAVAGATAAGMKAMEDDDPGTQAGAKATTTVTHTVTEQARNGGQDTGEDTGTDGGADGGNGSTNPSLGADDIVDDGTDGSRGAPPADGDTVGLTTLTPLASDGFTVKVAAIDGKDYDDAFVGENDCSGSMEFNLDRSYSTLEMTAGIEDNSLHDNAQLTVTVDGERLINEGLTLGRTNPITLELNKGLRMKIEYSDPDDSCYSGVVVLGSPILKK